MKTALVSSLLAGWVATQAAETHAVLDAWLAGQTNLRTWSAVCVQTRSLQTLAQPLVSTGRVWFAAPDRFRWELGQPAQTIAVRQGDDLTLAYPRLRRAERYSLGPNRSGPWRDALALLEAGFPRDRAHLESQFRLLSVTSTNDTWELSLQPGRPAARRFISEVRVALATHDSTLRATELIFADGSRMRNDFREILVNPPIDDAMFRPPVEAGYTVTDPLAR